MQNQSDWVSVYIYHEISFEKVIIDLIKPIIEDLESKNFISGYFFIRYWEKGPHIRLRVLAKNDLNRTEVIYSINSATHTYFEQVTPELNYSVEYQDYIREIERYGGDVNIENAEQQFEESSRMIINLINNNYKEWDYSLAISYAMQLHTLLVKSLFKNDIIEMINFFKKVHNYWLYHSLKLDDEGNYRQDEIEKVNLFFENSYQLQKNKINTLVKILMDDNFSSEWVNKWVLKNKIISEKFNNLKQKEETIYFVYDSLIHMTNNRLGIHLRDESYIAYLLFKSLENLE